ncbi:MAG TPA: hypothetical protein VFM05_01345 [Candidatus Saccharimonadales bacterium]|nr:hypothetical protein [Candidatus Saccharimonadales bacterium]
MPPSCNRAPLIYDLFAEDLRHCSIWGRWLIWDGKRWKVDETAAIWRYAKETVTSIYGEAQRAKGDDERRMNLAKWAVQSERFSRIGALIKLASSDESMLSRPTH